MLYGIVNKLYPWLAAHGMGFFRVFTYYTFQGIAAIVVSFIISIALGPRLIEWLRAKKFGDAGKFDQAEIDKLMEGKHGTPTMGGILIIAAIAISTLLLADLRNFYVL